MRQNLILDLDAGQGMTDVVVVRGSTECSPCGTPHPGVGRLDSGFGVIMGTVAQCDSTGSHLACELGPPCMVKSDHFAVTRRYESLGQCVAS